MMKLGTLNLYRLARIPVIGVLYAVLAALSWVAAFLIRFDANFHSVPRAYWEVCLQMLPWVIGAKLLLMGIAGQYRGMLSFFRISDAVRIGVASAVCALAAFVLAPMVQKRGLALPRGAILIDAVVFAALMVGFRAVLRRFVELKGNQSRQPRSVTRVAVIGAGSVGGGVISELLKKPSLGLQPVVVLDDNGSLHGLNVHRIPVWGSADDLPKVMDKFRIDKVLLAMPSAKTTRVREIVALCARLRLPCVTVPSMSQLASGKVTYSTIKPVAIEDLLGREPVTMKHEDICPFLCDRTVLVTGAGGSIGSELCRQIAGCRPNGLIILDHSEPALFTIEQELKQSFPEVPIIPVVASVLDETRLARIFGESHPEIVYHAAAHKHVPLMEFQPDEAVRNNSFGTRTLIKVAARFAVERFILISTDKAINPTSVMGASKRLAELYLQAFQQHHGSGTTRFSAVRFGNVLGSSGSVIPIFKQQIENGGPVTVTDANMTRFFMTIPEAVGLVLTSSTLSSGGEIFVLDMGESVRIFDLATQLIQLSGLEPGKDIEIQFTGMRPGEKLYEEISHRGEQLSETTHPRIMRFTGPGLALSEVEAHFASLGNSLAAADAHQIRALLHTIIPEYTGASQQSTAPPDPPAALSTSSPGAPPPKLSLTPS
jgi:FlaA1/EpsC-like NDP-sugar epimerase